MNHNSSSNQLVEQPSARETKTSRWITPNVFGLLVFAALMLFLWIFFTLPVSRTPARRMQSLNRLKNITLALHIYASANGGKLPDSDKKHSWMTMILMSLDRPDIHTMINHKLPWHDVANKEAFQTELNFFLNPSIDQTTTSNGYAATHYSINQNMFRDDRRITLDFISQKDGQANTILAGEINSNFPAWGDPANRRDLTLGLNNHPNGFGSPYKGHVNFAFADGRVQSISKDIDPDILKALSTPDGGETIDMKDY